MSALDQRRTPTQRLLALALLLSFLLPLWHSSTSHHSVGDASAVIEHATGSPTDALGTLEGACPICAASGQQRHGIDVAASGLRGPRPPVRVERDSGQSPLPAVPDHSLAPARAPPSLPLV